MNFKIANSAKKILPLLLISILFGCSRLPTIQSGSETKFPQRNEVPIATNFETSTQLKFQAAEHWKRAANDTVAELSKSLQNGGICFGKENCPTLVVKRSCQTSGCIVKQCESEFSKIFFNQFVSALVNSGQRVSTNAVPNGTEIDIDIQPIKFTENRAQYRFAGVKTEIGEGVWAIKDTALLIDNNGNYVQPNSDEKLHWHRAEFASGKTPSNEVVITVSARGSDKTYKAMNTSIYYFSDNDESHYICPTPAKTETPAIIQWAVPVVGDCSPSRCITCGKPNSCDTNKRQ